MATKGPSKATSAGGSANGGVASEAPLTAKELAVAKRQKKREVDRRCQREARQRTKARIAYLEELVDELRQQDTSGQVASLMEQVSAARTERDQFARTLRGIEDAIRGHQAILDNSTELITKQEEPESRDGDTSPARFLGYSMPTMAAMSSYDGVTMDMDGATYDETTFELSTTIKTAVRTAQYASPSSLAPGGSLRQTTLHPLIRRDTILPPEREQCLTCTPPNPTDPRPQSLWRFANEVLNAAPSLTERELRWEDQCADDTPVRAAVEGWEAVERRLGGTLPPLWRTLRRIDETIFKAAAPKERLAIMRLMHLLYRYHADPATQRARVPSWFLARPSQNIEHAYAIDFLCWPGVRERFVFSEHSYCTDLFWHLINKSLRILWQFDFRDCYTVDRSDGSYRISPAFEARIGDINAWAMGPAFFQQWPELYADIPSLEKSVLHMDRIGRGGGSTVSINGSGTPRRLLPNNHVLPPSSNGHNYFIGRTDPYLTHNGHAAAAEEADGHELKGDETDADADGVDDDDLGGASGFAAANSSGRPGQQRGMEQTLAGNEDDWLWLQSVQGVEVDGMHGLDGMDGPLGNMG